MVLTSDSLRRRIEVSNTSAANARGNTLKASTCSSALSSDIAAAISTGLKPTSRSRRSREIGGSDQTLDVRDEVRVHSSS